MNRASGRGVVLALIAVNVAVEVVLLGADQGLWGQGDWRLMAYDLGGFREALWRGEAGFPGQALTMMLTYGVLHSGLWHLAGNMLTLWLIGPGIAAHVGPGRFVGLYAVAGLAGAVCFGLLSDNAAPMVGASGAIFGLAGALVVWDGAARRQSGLPGRNLIFIAELVGLNLVLWVLSDGNLAWQAHLGGFAAGALWAWRWRG